MRTRRVSLIGRLVREFRQLRFAVERFYRRRAQPKLTPEQEAEQLLARLHRYQELQRRYGRH